MSYGTVQELNYEDALEFLQNVISDGDLDISNLENQSLSIAYEEEEVAQFQLPYLFSLQNQSEITPEALENLALPPSYLIILIQAGNAALAYYEEGELQNHKVIRRYMVRKKQGKNQLKHLESKGKSRLGSRIRLAETIEFFEEINQKITDWEAIEQVDYIFYHSSILLWNKVFESKVPTTFDKEDERLHKIPLDIQTPTFEEILQVQDFLTLGKLELLSDFEFDL